MPQEEREYLHARAIQERQRAAACQDEMAARIHLDLAGEYERRALRPGAAIRAATARRA